ncbi:hypothetical protein BGW41_005216 [Actinomortierella wolfii]|nr:hypothetical protein BGW41_005216 [Actinomortierella wolfii]
MPIFLGQRPDTLSSNENSAYSTPLSSNCRQRKRKFATIPSITLLLAIVISLFTITAEAKLDVTLDGGKIQSFPSWDPMMGVSDYYSMHGVLFMAQVDKDCVIRLDSGVAGSTAELMRLIGDRVPEGLVSVPVLRYDWLDNCATYDEIFKHIPDAEAGIKAAGLPAIGAIIMDGDSQSYQDFGPPFQQLADAPYWNHEARLNISYVGEDTIELLYPPSKVNDSKVYIATVTQEDGPWNNLWNSVGMKVLIRGIDVLTGLVFFFGIWVLIFICRAEQDKNHTRRYLTLIPGIIYLPLSIAFAPYKTTLPWRNAVYYVSLLFPFISLGLQIIMWSKLIYRIKRKPVNKVFAYFSYVTIGVPTIAAFLDGIGWLIPKVPIIRMVGEKGFMFCMPAIIIVQAGLIFYFAITFFRSLRNIAVSESTRTALVKITILNVAMISFFILMLLSRIISLLGLNHRLRGAYLAELIVFRMSFILFYGCCFHTLSIRQPTGSTVNSNNRTAGTGSGRGTHHSGSRTGAGSTTLYNSASHVSSSNSGGDGVHDGAGKNTHSHFGPGETPAKVAFYPHEKKISRQSSKGFTIPSPVSNDFSMFPPQNEPAQYGGATLAASPTLSTRSAKKYKHHSGMRIDEEEEDDESVYGNHLYQLKPTRNSRSGRQQMQHPEGYSRFDISDEDRSVHAV